MATQSLQAESVSANPNSEAFQHTCAMEDHLRVIDDLLLGLMIMSETYSEGSPVQTIAELARDNCREAEKLRYKLFRETHPNKAEFDRDGWPGDK